MAMAPKGIQILEQCLAFLKLTPPLKRRTPQFLHPHRVLLPERRFVNAQQILLSGALRGGWVMATASAHALAEALALFRRHVLPATGHAIAEMGAMAAKAVAAKQDAAERQQSEGLPEGKHPPAEQHGHEPVPQVHDGFTADKDKKHNANRGGHEYPFFSSHRMFLTSS
jgi:hypothetical protein